jgi:hypothetical protein
MKIEDDYDGPHLPDTITPESMLSLLNYYHESMYHDEITLLHTKYVLIILCDYLKVRLSSWSSDAPCTPAAAAGGNLRRMRLARDARRSLSPEA